MVSYFQDASVGAANDQISSLAMWGTAEESVDLFEDNCFGGYTRRFLSSIPNLHHHISWVNSILWDPTASIWIVLNHPNGHWGDRTSSIKGWSY